MTTTIESLGVVTIRAEGGAEEAAFTASRLDLVTALDKVLGQGGGERTVSSMENVISKAASDAATAAVRPVLIGSIVSVVISIGLFWRGRR